MNAAKEDLSILEGQWSKDKSPKASEIVNQLSEEIKQVSKIMELRNAMSPEQFKGLFNRQELEELAAHLQFQQTELNAASAGEVLELRVISQIRSSIDVTTERIIDTSSQFLERNVSQEQAKVLAESKEYDVYVSLRKAFVELTLQNQVIRNKMDALKIEYIRSNDTLAQRVLGMKLISTAAELQKNTNQKIQKSNQMQTMKEHESFARLISEGILPQGQRSGITLAEMNRPEDVAFSIQEGIKGQNNQYPISQVSPKGLVFRVQVGAFRNKVPDYFFREFTPVSGEQLKNGLTAYLAGFFEGSEGALKARNTIRTLGYKDAFIVAYCDGKRIAFPQAIAYEKNGFCTVRKRDELLKEAFSLLKEASRLDSVTAAKPKEVFYTVQVASLAKEDNGKLSDVPELFYQKSITDKFKYSSGKFKDMAEAKKRREELKNRGYTDAYIVAYRDGINVSFNEAEIAMNYLQEPLTEVSPENLSLTGAVVPIEQPSYVQFKKSEKIQSKEQLGGYNSLRFMTVNSQNQVSSAPIEKSFISPLELIFYADFDLQELSDYSSPIRFSMEESSSYAPLLHDLALNNNIPYHVIKDKDHRIQFLFYVNGQEETVWLDTLTQKMKIQR